MILSPFGRLASFFELYCVLRSLSALRALGFASLCIAQLPNPLRVLSKTQPGWIMNIPAVGLIGSRTIILAMGYWLLAMGWSMRRAVIRAFRLIAVSPHHIITFTL